MSVSAVEAYLVMNYFPFKKQTPSTLLCYGTCKSCSCLLPSFAFDIHFRRTCRNICDGPLRRSASVVPRVSWSIFTATLSRSGPARPSGRRPQFRSSLYTHGTLDSLVTPWLQTRLWTLCKLSERRCTRYFCVLLRSRFLSIRGVTTYLPCQVIIDCSTVTLR